MSRLGPRDKPFWRSSQNSKSESFVLDDVCDLGDESMNLKI